MDIDCRTNPIMPTRFTCKSISGLQIKLKTQNISISEIKDTRYIDFYSNVNLNPELMIKYINPVITRKISEI